MNPPITVLLPVYNGERFLGKAIESVLNQTFRDFELLIVDDGSTDASVNIVRSFNDKRIRLIRNEMRRKLSGALNRGLDSARGRYVARMDADDICLPQRLERQKAFLDSHPEMGICGCWTRFFGMNQRRVRRAPSGPENVKAHMVFDNPFSHPTVMLRKEFFDRHHLRYNGAYYPTEDYELWSRALPLFPGDNLEEVLLKYRLHRKSMTRSDWDNMDEKAMRIVGRFLEKAGVKIDSEQLRFHRSISREGSMVCTRRKEILRGEKWFRHLCEVNRRSRFVSSTALPAAAAQAWFRLCFNSSALGGWVVRTYIASDLITDRKRHLHRALLIYLSFLKKSLRDNKGARTV